MEVILRQHVETLGKRGEIVKVAAGYARNYLLPRKLALPVVVSRLARKVMSAGTKRVMSSVWFLRMPIRRQ